VIQLLVTAGYVEAARSEIRIRAKHRLLDAIGRVDTRGVTHARGVKPF
jgi:hypothetical protein